MRFSLRSLLMLTTGLCLWLGWQSHRAREQREALALLRRVPVGSISFDPRAEDIWAPAWLRKQVGDDFFQSVVEVHLTDGVNSQNLPAVVDQLVRLPKLRELYLWHARVTDDDLRHLAPLTQITKLGLHFPHEPVTGRGLRHVVHLQNIRELWLSGRSMSNDALEFVPKFRQLESLELGLFGVDDDGLRRVAECTRLKSLSLTACSCSNIGLRTIAAIPALRRIDFSNMSVQVSIGYFPPVADEQVWYLVPSEFPFDDQGNVLGIGVEPRSFDLLRNWLRMKKPNLELNWGWHS